ncbi:MAG: DUF4239 domain-containing protein [Hyphomicrobiales bacterium]|nr:DUF4239 domain-containing protein [Hyphomicrobiales bacterium]
MSPELLAGAIGLVVLAAGLLGLALQSVLPDSFTTGGPRDMIGAVAGMLVLLSALVMGLLIWTAYGVYAGQNAAVQTLAAKVLQLDLSLADYGPEAQPEREKLKEIISKTVDEVWGAGQGRAAFAARNFSAALQNLHNRDTALAALHPSTDAQKAALARADAATQSIAQSRLQMSFALSDPVSYPLIWIVAGWAALIFCGFGLTSKAHTMSVIMVFVGSLALATAFYLILDLSNPYEGLFRASSAPLEQVLAVLGRE